MIVDFHCHTNCSDGELTPKELVDLALDNNVSMLSITDHDTIDAYKALVKSPIKLIPGIEFSTKWNKVGIHVVGLNIDTQSKLLNEVIETQKQLRFDRAVVISKRLEKIGLTHALETIQKTKGDHYIGRPDFALLLVEKGICKNMNQAFKKYLGAGKLGDVKHQWLSMNEIINAIKYTGGVAVLAHPLYYRLTNMKLRRLLTDFKELGGEGLEVVNGFQNIDKTIYLAELSKEYNLKASMGSDFHSPHQWKKIGCNSEILKGLDPIWLDF